MKKYAWLGVACIVFVTFQNCAPAPQSGVQTDSSNLKTETTFNKVLADNFSTLSLWDSGCDERCTLAELQQSQPKYIDIVIQSNNPKKIGFLQTWPLDIRLLQSKYCLVQERLDALLAILAGAEVCEPVLPDHYFDGRVCTMNYTNPYAILKFDQQQQMTLGEKTSGCDIPVDLCGDKAAQLKTWRSTIIGHLDDPAVTTSPLYASFINGKVVPIKTPMRGPPSQGLSPPRYAVIVERLGLQRLPHASLHDRAPPVIPTTHARLHKGTSWAECRG